MDQTTLIGTSGAFIVLVAYLLNQANRLNRTSFGYDFLNFVGSLLLVIYSYLIDSLPFLVLNGIWGLVSLKDIILFARRSPKS